MKCLIITGAGDKIFCAGADLGSAFAGPDVGAFHPLWQLRPAPHRALPQARHRGHQRPCPRRRLRDLHGLPYPHPEGDGADGADGVEPGHHPRLRRDTAIPSLDRPRARSRAPDPRHADPRPGVLPDRLRQSPGQGGRDAQRRQGPGARDRQAAAHRVAPHHRGGGRRHPGAHRPGHRDRGARLREGRSRRRMRARASRPSSRSAPPSSKAK